MRNVGLGKGGRPARSPVLAYFDRGNQWKGTWSQVVERMIMTGDGFSVECDVPRRRSVRASITTTARRQGARVKTEWKMGRIWVKEVRE